MVTNPAGYQPILDFGTPMIVSGRARVAISGGEFLSISGAADVISSGANSFNPVTDFLFNNGASGTNFVGIATHNADSGASISVAMGGVFLVTCSDATVASDSVQANGGDAVVAGVVAGKVIGKALTGAGSEGFLALKLNA